MNLNELQRLAEGASEGPWHTDQHGLGVYVPEGYAIASLMTKSGAHENHEANAAFIAAMREAVPKLIAVARAAQMLYDDTMDYIRINNLGGENNHSIAALRTALEELQ